MIACWKQDGTWEPGPLEKPYGRGVNFQILTDDIKTIYQNDNGNHVIAQINEQ